jgi:glucose/arabinose dehydrogenase
VSFGRDYSGRRVSEHPTREGIEQPLVYWVPAIAAAGMAVYTGDRFPAWKGHLFIGSLSPGGLVRLELRGDRVVREERYLGELRERIRDVKQGPDGLLYLITDSRNGRILRVSPAR